MSNGVVSPSHYHIRWVTSGELDWEPHATRTQAEEAGKQISLLNEQYSVERFDETCVKCATRQGRKSRSAKAHQQP